MPPNRFGGVLGALRRLSLSEWIVLTQSLLAIPVITLLLKRRGLQWTQRLLTRLSPLAEEPTADTGAARRWSRMVGIAGSRGVYRPNCLQRSLPLWMILRRRGFDPALRIGVAPPSPQEGLRFHAWIEVEGEVVNDRRDIASEFHPFSAPVDSSLAAFD